MATLHELLAQKMAIERQIEQIKRQGRSGAIAAVRALMDEYGLTPDDLTRPIHVKRDPSRPIRKVPAKFRNSSTGESWSGRGLQPRWLKAALASGKTISDFAITG